MNKDTPSLVTVAREILRLDNWGSYKDRVYFYDNHAADLARGYRAAVEAREAERAKVERLREALRAAEWSRPVRWLSEEIHCAACHSTESQGHKTDCPVYNALKEATDGH